MNKTRENKNQNFSRRAFLTTAVAAPMLVAKFPFVSIAKADIKIISPDSRVRFELLSRVSARLNYRITFKNKEVIETSQIGILIDGVDITEGIEVGKVESYRVRERYAWNGVHSEAVNNCNGMKIHIKHKASNADYILEIRAFNDGIAFRHIVNGDNVQRVPDEATNFIIPEKSFVWYHDFHGHYEGVHAKKEISEVKESEWAAVPLTIKLPNNLGYASITEGALINYSGMGLQADGKRGFKTVLGHALPVSHPFDLRYKADIERLSTIAAVTGTITSPWRVVMIGEDLNVLVNCDIVNNVSPPPDKTLFPKGSQTDWIKPGRAVWKFIDGGENTLEGMKEFSRLAGQLGFEYNVVEGFWQRWTENQMRELVDYSKEQKVGIFFWKHSRDLRTPETRQKFFELCNRVGVVGAKIDFFDHEAKEIIDLYQVLLKESAEYKIMVDFHGANKPAGESRTFPNEMTREGVYGLEHRSMTAWAKHNATIPFARFLSGHGDYTPLIFGERRRETTWTHQIATAAVFNSPVMIYAAHPKSILENPAAEMIKSIPSVWDETIALPVSEIGEVAAFARRKGNSWFLAILNGTNARIVKINLSFLGKGKYQAMFVRDVKENPAAVKIENVTATRADILSIDLQAGGGFISRFDSI